MRSFTIVAALVAVLAVATGAKAQYSANAALEMAYLSAAAYCTEAQILDWNCEACGELSNFNATIYVQNAALNVAAYVGHYIDDPSTAVVSFRGTIPTSLKDWIDDLYYAHVAEYPSCPGCTVHSGFFASYTALSEGVLNELARLNPSTVHVTGHSLGAAEAALAAVDIIKAGFNVGQVITFGQPRVGNPTFATAYDQYLGPSYNYRVVHYADIVPHLPTIDMGFHHVATEVWYQEDNVQYQVCNGSGEDPNCSDSLDAPISIEDHLHYMGIPISNLC